MRTTRSKIWAFFFTRLSCLDVWLKEAEGDYREPLSLSTCVDWVIGKPKTLGAAALPSVTALIQLVVPGSELDLYRASVVRRKLNTKSNDRTFRVFVAAMARPDEQRRPSSLRRLVKYLVEVLNVLCPFGPSLSFFPADTTSVRSRGRVVVEIFYTSVATRLEQAMSTSSVIIACYAADARSKQRFRAEGGAFVAPRVLNPDRTTGRNAHRIV